MTLVFGGQIFASTFQATFFRDADAALSAAGFPDCLLPSQRFKAEELARRLRLGGLMTAKWQGLPFHFQVEIDKHKLFPNDPVMQLALFLFPCPNNMFLPNQAVSDPISCIDFRILGLLAAGHDLRTTASDVPDILYKNIMSQAMVRHHEESVHEIDEDAPVGLTDIFKSAIPRTDLVKFYVPNLFKQQGARPPFFCEGELEQFAEMPKLDAAQIDALLQSFYKLVLDADSAAKALNYPDNSVAQMFLTFAFLKAKTPEDLAAFYNGLRAGMSTPHEGDAASILPFTADIFANTFDMYTEYQAFMAQADQVTAFKNASLQQRRLILAATQLFDISYLPIVNMGSAFYQSGKKSTFTFSDCVETALRNMVLSFTRRLDAASGVVYDGNLLPSTAKPELKDFVRTRNTFTAQTSEDARTAWSALVSKVPGTRYMKPSTKQNELERSCEIRAGHKNVLNILGHLFGIDFALTDASNGADIIAAYTRICGAFSRDGFQVTCKVCEDDELERNGRINDFFGKLEFQVNGKPMLTFNMETTHGETEACGSATAPKFLTDLLEQEGPENFVALAGANTLVRMITKDNVVQMFGQLSAAHQREFLMLLPDEADVLVLLIDHFNKHTSAYTGSMYHKMLTQRVLQLDDARANKLLFDTFDRGLIPIPIEEVVVDYASSICQSPDDRADNSLLIKALMHNPWQAWIDGVIERANSINCVDYKGRAVISSAQVNIVDRMLRVLPKCHNLMTLVADIHSEKQAEQFFGWLQSSRLDYLGLVVPNNMLPILVNRIPSTLRRLGIDYDAFRPRYSLDDLVKLEAEKQGSAIGIAVGSYKPSDFATECVAATNFAAEFCARNPKVSLQVGLGGEDFKAKLIDAFKERKLDYRRVNSYDSALQDEFAKAYQDAGIVLPGQAVEAEDDVAEMEKQTTAPAETLPTAKKPIDDEVLDESV